jgi:hypothetical protein
MGSVQMQPVNKLVSSLLARVLAQNRASWLELNSVIQK